MLVYNQKKQLHNEKMINNYDEVPKPSNPNMTKKALIELKKGYKAGDLNMGNIKVAVDRGSINLKEANYVTDGAYSN